MQRPLWASTSVKNPSYPDLMYVEPLVGKDTVNTVPPNTLEAILDHGQVQADTVEQDVGRRQGARRGAGGGQDLALRRHRTARRRRREVVRRLVPGHARRDPRQARQAARRHAAAGGAGAGLAPAAPPRTRWTGWPARDFLRKLWAHDPAPWSSDPAHVAIIKNALGWVDIAEKTKGSGGELAEFALTIAKRFDHVVVLGMGGSSLAPDILRETFGKRPGYPQLHVLDSTDPQQIKALDEALDIAKSVFIVASKSGTTTEPDAFFRYFFQCVQQTVGADNAADHFIAITDPDTKLQQEAKDTGFLRIFTNAPDIGGRYSALSFFGMVPAALAGIDIDKLLGRATNAMHANAASVDVHDAPGVRFGAALGALAKAGRDKLTIVCHPTVRAFGAWAEQLVAESTGKSGTGIVPVEGEPLGEPRAYGDGPRVRVRRRRPERRRPAGGAAGRARARPASRSSG